MYLPDASHVFAMRQGEQFMFFDFGEIKVEPVVFFYVEGGGRFDRIADCFWDIIERELELSEEHCRHTNEDSGLDYL